MGLLPIVLIVVFLLNNKGGLKDFLGGVDLKSLSPILSLLGADGKIIDTLSSPEVEKILSGNADIKSLLPLITSLMTKNIQPLKESENKIETEDIVPEYLNPIKDLALQEILSSLGGYFSN